MKKQSWSTSTVVLLLILIAFFMLVYVYGSNPQFFWKSMEKFGDDKYSLVPGSKLAIYQGNSIPDTPFSPVKFDDHESLPTVDGTDKGDKSLFMMAFNKCDPSCCPSTYSCSGGCVCMTKEQKDFIGTRGKNNKSTKCSGVSEF